MQCSDYYTEIILTGKIVNRCTPSLYQYCNNKSLMEHIPPSSDKMLLSCTPTFTGHKGKKHPTKFHNYTKLYCAL